MEKNATYETLPVAFQRRIDRMRKNPQNSAHDEWMDLFVCAEAAKIVERAHDAAANWTAWNNVVEFWQSTSLRTAAAGLRFTGSLYETEPATRQEQWLLWTVALNSRAYAFQYARQTAVLGLSPEHSGTTLSVAFGLARAVIRGDEV